MRMVSAARVAPRNISRIGGIDAPVPAGSFGPSTNIAESISSLQDFAHMHIPTKFKGILGPRSRLILPLFFWLLALPVQAPADKDDVPLTTVPAVDLSRYLGKWYEIASYPAWFQKGCTGSTADYSLLPDGRIRVVNRCFKKRLDGPLKESKGIAEVVDTVTHAKLKSVSSGHSRVTTGLSIWPRTTNGPWWVYRRESICGS
jgi:hypothetical protein